MTQILVAAGNFFILIVALMGMQSCYFKARWGWFWLMLACVLVSGACIGVEFYQMAVPEARQFHVTVREPTTPL